MPSVLRPPGGAFKPTGCSPALYRTHDLLSKSGASVARRVVMSKMSWLAKLGLVIGGYVAACLVAYGAVYLHDLIMDPAGFQTSAGMSAFCGFFLFVGVFRI